MAREKKGYKNYLKDDCFYCEGSEHHWGKACGACDGTGSEKVRKQLVKVYNAKNNIPIRTNVKIDT